MIEDLIVAALVAFLNANKPAAPFPFVIRPFDSDEPLNGPPLITVQVKSAKPRIRGTNLFDVDIELALRANPDDTPLDKFTAAWSWISSVSYPATQAATACNTDKLLCYTLQGDPSDSEVTLDETERRRAIALRGVFVAKNLA